MTGRTYAHQAQERVAAEQAAVAAKAEAFESFASRVSELPTESASAAATGVRTTASVQQRAGSATEGGCRQVRTAFAEAMPHCSADDGDSSAVLATLRAELSESVAAALAPTTETALTAPVRATVVSAAQARQAELAAVDRALDRETTQLATAVGDVEAVTDWLVAADETRLSALGFDALRGRHERLDGQLSRCERLASRRQAFLSETTTGDGDATVSHRQLVVHLYEDFPVDHPVLATAATLASTCRSCQRAVRDHLVARA